jgi:hypothetical protein
MQEGETVCGSWFNYFDSEIGLQPRVRLNFNYFPSGIRYQPARHIRN